MTGPTVRVGPPARYVEAHWEHGALVPEAERVVVLWCSDCGELAGPEPDFPAHREVLAHRAATHASECHPDGVVNRGWAQ